LYPVPDTLRQQVTFLYSNGVLGCGINRILDAPADPTLLFELCADLSQAPESQAFCFVRSVPAAGARRAFASDANDTGFHALTAR